jgi:anti-sigma regulatory factor (Ser/Thr protein kinase)
LEATPPRFADELTEPTDLAGLRRGLRAALTAAAVPVGVVDEIVVAVSEIATNGLIHGRPPVRVRAWSSGDQVRCTVTDQGGGHDLPLVGYLPPATPAQAGAGVWVARHTVDRLSSTHTRDGFTVRLTTGIHPGEPSH